MLNVYRLKTKREKFLGWMSVGVVVAGIAYSIYQMYCLQIAMGSARYPEPGYYKATYALRRLVESCLICVASFSLGLCKWWGSGILSIFVRQHSVRVSEHYFPRILEIVEAHARRLGLRDVPAVYIWEGEGWISAFVSKCFVRRTYLVLYASLVEETYEKDEDALSFAIAHELGHIAAGHLHWSKLFIPLACAGFLGLGLCNMFGWYLSRPGVFVLKCLPSQYMPRSLVALELIYLFLPAALLVMPLYIAARRMYARAGEYTADRVGASLVPAGAENGIVLLEGGPLTAYIDKEAFLKQRDHISTVGRVLACLSSSHPFTADRLQAVRRAKPVAEQPEEGVAATKKS